MPYFARVFSIDKTNFHRWVIPVAVSTLLFAVLLFLFPYNSGDSSINSPLGLALWQTWTAALSSTADQDVPDRTYCLLVPLMVGYLLYEKRSEIASAVKQGNTAGLAAIVLGFILFWIGSRAGKQYLGCAGIQIILLGIIFWFWGSSVFRKLLFTWAIIAFAWPLPFLDTAVAFPMRMIVSTSAFYVLKILGIGCIQNGTAIISTPTAPGLPFGTRFQIDVADPCSGLHSLLPLLMFSAFFCYFFLPRLWQQWTVFLSAFVFTIVGNVVRILMLVFGSMLWGSDFAIGTNSQPSTYHEGCGFFVFVIVLGLECLFGFLLIRLGDSGPKQSAASPSILSTPTETPDWRSGVILGVAAAMLCIYWITPPVYLPTEAGVVMSLPDEVKLSGIDGGHFYGSEAQVSDVEHRLLPKDTEFARMNYDDFHNHSVFFSIVLSGVQQYTIHPPEVCLVAQGWTIVGQEDVPIQLKSGNQLVVRNLTLQRDAMDRNQVHHLVKAYYMYWYVADNLATPSHMTRNWMSSWDRVVHNRDHRWAYVIAMSPITETIRPDGLNAAQTRDLLSNFIRQIVPSIQKSELAKHADNS